MRLFIGVWLSEAMQKEVINYIALIKGKYPGFKWTTPDNLHFTLKFLGEVSSLRLPDLNHALTLTADQNSGFRLELGIIGSFPGRGIPKIIWIGVAAGQAELVNLANSVESNCCQNGFPATDKPFKPHLTLARAKNDVKYDLALKISEPETYFVSETKVTEISLIESRLFPTGPIYKTIETYKFGNR
jgi:2'-5' RNA ligase